MLDSMNIVYILAFALVVIGLAYLIIRKQMQTEVMEQIKKHHEKYEIHHLREEIKDMLFHMTSSHFHLNNKSEELYKREINKRARLKKALKGCNNGSYDDKAYIVDLIASLLKDYLLNKEDVDQVMYFAKPGFLTAKDKFDILIYHYFKKYGGKGLSKLIEEEGWHLPKMVEDETLPVYSVSKLQVEEAFYNRKIQLDYDDKIAIIAQRIYEGYKGFGVIDKIRDCDIDGVSGGVSGVVDTEILSDESLIKDYEKYPRNYESVWIFYKGKSIHFSFLSFGSERELKRVCQSIYRYNKAGQLSEDVGYKVNEMKDGSRIVVVRPPLSESWAFFVRKFHIKNIALEELIKGDKSDRMIDLLKFLMKGGRITAVTGAQGSGKTTMLMAMIRHIYPTLTLRVQEMAFELNLRKLYPKRNILTFKETEDVSGQEGLDLQKKTDGTVNILGEIATDEISVLMLQMAQVASLFTVFTHHAKTVSDLVLSLRNSLLKCNVFRDEKIAEEQVVRVLDFDIHLNKDYEGNRYIERVTELVAVEEKDHFRMTFEDQNKDKMLEFMHTVVEYFEKRTLVKTYEKRVIFYYKNGGYHAGETMTKESVEQMMSLMTEADRQDFREFIASVWGREDANLYQYT